MLNEIYRAAVALDQAGIKLQKIWHRDMHPFGGNIKNVRLWLSGDGTIVRVDALDEPTCSNLRKYQPSNQFSFPAMNLNYLRGYSGEAKHTPEECKEDVLAAIRKFDKKINSMSVQCERMFRSGMFDDTPIYKELLRILSDVQANEFRERFEEAMSKSCMGGSLSPSESVHVVFDVNDYKQFSDYPVSHPNSVDELNAVLLAKDIVDETAVKSVDGVDIFGSSNLGCDAKVKTMNVPLLGKLSVFSLNEATQAQSRYGLSSVSTCPLGERSRKRIREALGWLTDATRDGLTWGKLDADTLVLSFALKIPQRKISLARLFGSITNGEDVDIEISFEDWAGAAISLLKGEGGIAKSDVAFVVLHKMMDGKRVKVICDQVVSVEALEKRSKEWSEGFANVPEISVREWPFVRREMRTKEGNIPQVVRAKSILPLRLHRILNEVYKQNGESSVVSVARFSVADDANLFLGTDCTGLAFSMIEQYMRCSRGYFLKLCRGLCIKDKGFRAVTQMKRPGEHLGTLGLLLKKSNINKENYMKGIPYQLGRFLRVADELHSLYCEIVRKNDIPNELCGSSLLLAMMENPESALQQLAMRSNPYVKWSQTYHGENAGLVHYWRRHWSEMADQLSEGELPKHLTVAEQAQMFLGFLASFPKSGSIECESGNNQTEKENQ